MGAKGSEKEGGEGIEGKEKVFLIHNYDQKIGPKFLLTKNLEGNHIEGICACEDGR